MIHLFSLGYLGEPHAWDSRHSKCRCNLGEDNCHYFLHCTLYEVSRVTLLSNTSRTIDNDISVFPPITEIILKRNNVYNHITNKLILTETLPKRLGFRLEVGGRVME